MKKKCCSDRIVVECLRPANINFAEGRPFIAQHIWFCPTVGHHTQTTKPVLGTGPGTLLTPVLI